MTFKSDCEMYLYLFLCVYMPQLNRYKECAFQIHWAQNILNLAKWEGGQRLVHLHSRNAAFRLQFLQRFLMGPENVSWRALIILKSVQRMNLVKPLVLMDPIRLTLVYLLFYQHIFKVWSCFNVKKPETRPHAPYFGCWKSH